MAELSRGVRAARPDPAAGRARRGGGAPAGRRGRPLERYDADSVQARVARNYRELARQHPNVQVLDGSGDLETVAEAIARAVDGVCR